MVTIKGYTDIKQSKALAKILPLESADMVYIWHATSDNPVFRFDEDMPPMVLKDVPIDEITADTLPCWSLAALLSALPRHLDIGRPALITNYEGYYWVSYFDEYMKEKFTSKIHNNPVDACVAMIEKLHKLKLI